MFKKIQYGLTSCIMLFQLSASAQDSLNKGSCGLTATYVQSMGVDSPGVGASAIFTPPASFPATAKDTCGKFIVYYEDLRPGAVAGGFNAGSGVGATRRSTLCSVLSYIQTVFDFSNIPTNQYIRLHVDTSYSIPGRLPIITDPIFSNHGFAAPYYRTGSVFPGARLNGFVHEYITSSSGTDPNPGDYHANLIMNFTSMSRGIVDMSRNMSILDVSPMDFNNGLDTPGHCQYDLYSILLHMVSHTMGWFSWHDKGSSHGVSATALPVSNYDTSLYQLPDPKTHTDPFSSKTKLIGPPLCTGCYFLVNALRPPYNYFIFYGDPYTGITEFSHLAPIDYSYLQRITPGDYHAPVMAVPFRESEMVREYTKADLETFTNNIGLHYKSSFSSAHSATIANHVPWSSRMNSDAYNAIAKDLAYAEIVPADFVLTNNTGASVVINLNGDTSLHDADHDSISFIPGSIVNFRGCGDGGNNHDRLTLSNSNRTITYTPRHNFYGRAQFGGNLYDGTEKGAFVLFTIEVKPGTNVSATKGDNLVVNGDFEEGAEVKLSGGSEAKNNSYTIGSLSPGDRAAGRLNGGTPLSDGHPYDCNTDFIYGTAIRNSYTECSYVKGLSFGSPANFFPWPWVPLVRSNLSGIYGSYYSDGYPDAVTTTGTNNRYQPLGQDGILLNLKDSLRQCKRYILEFDAVRTFGVDIPYSYPSTDKVNLGFTNSGLINGLTTTPMIRTLPGYAIPAITNKGVWKHFKMPFSYCADTPANVVRLKIDGAYATNEYIPTTLLDNVVITEVDLALSIKIIDSAAGGCTHALLAGPVSTGCPSMIYTWKNSLGTTVGTDRIYYTSPLDTTSYNVTVFDGCSTAYDTIAVIPCRCAPVRMFASKAYSILSGTVTGSKAAGYYYVPADINISGTTTFTNAIMLIEPGVTITVLNNAKLTLDSSHLFTCPDTNRMWRGIVLASGSTSSGCIEVKKSTLIEDALYAIDAVNMKQPFLGDVISVTNSTFNRNQVDIGMSNYKSTASSTIPVTIYGNLFTARAFDTMTNYPKAWRSTPALKAPFTATDSKPAYIINRDYAKSYCKDTTVLSYLCVRATEMGVTSSGGSYQSEIQIGKGMASDDYNLFDNHRYGFVDRNSNATLYNNHFINICRRMKPTSSTTTKDTVENGMAVVLQSDAGRNNRINIVISPFANVFNHFHDCFMGIYSENIWTQNINYTRITTSNKAGSIAAGAAYPSELYAGYGMMIYHNKNLLADNINNNTISNCNVGMSINIMNPPTGAAVAIDHNTIKSKNPDISAGYTGGQYINHALELWGNAPSGTQVATMTTSNNTLTDVFTGIICSGYTTAKCSLVNNTITLKDTVTPVTLDQYGISVTAGSGVTASGNSISTPSLSATSDRIRGVSAAFNTNLRICGNTVTNMGRGFEFAPGAAQTATRWIGNAINNGYNGMRLGSDIGDQGYMVDWVHLFPPTFWGANRNIWTGSWSTPAAKNQTVAVFPIDTRRSKLWVKNLPSGSAERPTTNVASPPTYTYPYAYNYSAISGYSILIPTSQTDANCDGAIYPSKVNPIPRPGLIGKTLGILIMSDSLGYSTDYNPIQWMNQLSLYELGTIQPDLRDSSGILDTFMTAAASSRFGWLTDISLALDNDDTVTADSLLINPVAGMGRISVNNDVVVTDYNDADYIVGNYVDYYTIYLHYIQSKMTGADSSLIEILAHKCPATDGAAVYKARALFQRISMQTVDYNDDSCEYSGNFFRVTQNGIDVQQEQYYTLYPNPNKGQFSISQAIAGNRTTEARLYNALGMQLSVQPLQFTNGLANFNTGNVAPGLYLLCITDEEEKTVCLKFNIQ